jgi:hypothetical protein
MPDTLENKSEKEQPEKKTKKNPPVRLPDFDPDVPWYEEHNRDAARARGLSYDRRSRVYRDEDGCPTLDKFGQPL